MRSNGKLKSIRPYIRGVLNFFLAALLSLQLIALTQHHHDLSTQQDNCAACNLALHFSGGTPTIPVALPLMALILAYWIAVHPVRIIDFVPRRYVRPLSQAPPFA